MVYNTGLHLIFNVLVAIVKFGTLVEYLNRGLEQKAVIPVFSFRVSPITPRPVFIIGDFIGPVRQ